VANRHGWKHLIMAAHVDLCFAYAEMGRTLLAARHGRIGLQMAEAAGAADWIKNALYLLGEVAMLAGASQDGRARFRELQERFYPHQAYLADFLINVDVRNLVNLRA
jgi:hypothetical protein